MCIAMALFYVFTGSGSTSFMFKASDPAARTLMHSAIFNYCRRSIPSIAKVERTGNMLCL